MLCLMLLSACTEPEIAYDYGLTWTCRSPEGCERTEEVSLIDRLNTSGDAFFFHSRRDMNFRLSADRVASDSLPDGCSLLYAFVLFGHELEPSKVCRSGDGFEMEFSIPNANPATHSKWLVEARDLGPW
jgi:hypothetical protein